MESGGSGGGVAVPAGGRRVGRGWDHVVVTVLGTVAIVGAGSGLVLGVTGLGETEDSLCYSLLQSGIDRGGPCGSRVSDRLQMIAVAAAVTLAFGGMTWLVRRTTGRWRPAHRSAVLLLTGVAIAAGVLGMWFMSAQTQDAVGSPCGSALAPDHGEGGGSDLGHPLDTCLPPLSAARHRALTSGLLGVTALAAAGFIAAGPAPRPSVRHDGEPERVPTPS